MAAKSKCAGSEDAKTGQKRTCWLKYWTIATFICLFLYYIWRKCCELVALSQQNDDQGWWILKQFSTDKERLDVNSTFSGSYLYLKLLSLIKEDIIFCLEAIKAIVSSVTVDFSSNGFISGILLTLVTVFSVYFVLLRQTSDSSGRTGKRETRRDNGNKKSSKSSEHLQDVLRHRGSTWYYWKWVTLLVFVAFLLSIPWEFVRLYQTMVAEKVAQVTAGTPAECLPEQMSLTQSLRSWIRWQFSWTQDPCLQYHKALLVDPMWQVPPLMVISSAVSHCLVYPVEVFFGGLGRAFRIFFTEIPVAWQPMMMFMVLILLILILIMAFGYRIHLPFILKFEPKTPVSVRRKERKTVPPEKPAMNPESVESSQDTAYGSSQDTQWSLESSYS